MRRPFAISRRHLLASAAASFAFGHGARAAEYSRSWTFGNVTVSKIVEMSAPLPARRHFPDAPLDVLDENASWLAPHFYDPATKNDISTYQAYVVRTQRIVLVMDGGYGDFLPSEAERPGQHRESFVDNLRRAGVAPEQVTHVINSHFHADHIGWNTRRDGENRVPMYPKARYLFDRKEYDATATAAATNAGTATAFNACVKPVMEAGVGDLIDGDLDLGDGLRIVATPGHTPGHHSLAIASKGRRAILSGDVIHNPIEVLHPEWTMGFDADKDAARAQRIKFVDAHTDVDVTILAAHFGGPTAGKIVSEKGGKRVFRTLVP